MFGDFLAGAYASRVDDYTARTAYYAKAFERVPEDVFIGRRALTYAVLDGDMDLARKLAADMLSVDGVEPMARMVAGQGALKRGRHARAATLFGPDTQDLTMGIAMDIMQGWNAVAMGDETAARAAFETIGGGPDFKTLAELQLAIMDNAAGEVDAALARLDGMAESELYEVEVVLTRARIMGAAGRATEARDLLVEFNRENGNPESGPVPDAIAALSAGKSLRTEFAPHEYAARALTEPTYSFFVRNRALDAAELYLRMAVDLDPDYDKAKIWLGNILEASDRDAQALALYDSITEDSAYVVSARLAKANVYFGMDEDGKALKTLEAINALRPSVITREALGRARLIRENYAEALPIYDALIASLTDEQLAADTQPLYFRGIAREREGDFDGAVADFKRVLSFEPDDADALNYLGYTWVDRGENLQEAFEMIERAVELEPDSGAIVDSLGWAHYRLGRYEEAKAHLEKAAELTPTSATIIDHLGDVYWKLGRFREAGYQWSRALGLDPDDEERANIRAKLKGGLDAAIDLSP